MNDTPTPDNAAPSAIVLDISATPICLANGAQWGHTGTIGVGEGVERGAYLYSAATVAALEAEVERLREEAYRFRRLAGLLDGFDFRLGRNVLMPPATYLDSVEITSEFQPGVGQTVIDAIMDTLTGARAK